MFRINDILFQNKQAQVKNLSFKQYLFNNLCCQLKVYIEQWQIIVTMKNKSR